MIDNRNFEVKKFLLKAVVMLTGAGLQQKPSSRMPTYRPKESK